MNHWQQAVKESFTSPTELLSHLQLTPEEVGLAAEVAFPMRVPKPFVARMQPGNPHDPLLLQVLPKQEELLAMPGYTNDPVGDLQANCLPGLLHKYHGRVLLTLTGACAIHCRYCFRRHYPYDENTPGMAGWQRAVDYVAADSTIEEVIYSGGDPLVLKDPLLASLSERFAAIEHVSTLRIHTRLPIVIPERIDDQLIKWMQDLPLHIVVVVHVNHPNEIDDRVVQQLQRLTSAATVLNQSVLLKDINDTLECQVSLCKRLFAAGVMPYYLHVLDKVNGAAHFEVDDVQARQLHQQMALKLPGYLMPKLVREVAGAGSKVWL